MRQLCIVSQFQTLYISKTVEGARGGNHLKSRFSSLTFQMYKNFLDFHFTRVENTYLVKFYVSARSTRARSKLIVIFHWKYHLSFKYLMKFRFLDNSTLILKTEFVRFQRNSKEKSRIIVVVCIL